MTHDELLAKIHSKGTSPFDTIKYDLQGQKNIQEVFNALRAVVELHKPVINPNSKELDSWCFQCAEGRFYAKYPCPTIQTIEKELQ